MATVESLREAIAIIEKANQRSRRVRNAAKYLCKQIAAAPIQWGNFHDSTRAIFQQVPLENINGREPDFVSPSGSMYWRSRYGVLRLSDHWGLGIRSCDWYLRRFDGQKADEYTTALGFCAWENFRRDHHEIANYFMVSPNGREELCHPASYVKKGFSLRKQILSPAIYWGYKELIGEA